MWHIGIDISFNWLDKNFPLKYKKLSQFWHKNAAIFLQHGQERSFHCALRLSEVCKLYSDKFSTLSKALNYLPPATSKVNWPDQYVGGQRLKQSLDTLCGHYIFFPITISHRSIVKSRSDKSCCFPAIVFPESAIEPWKFIFNWAI